LWRYLDLGHRVDVPTGAMAGAMGDDPDRCRRRVRVGPGDVTDGAWRWMDAMMRGMTSDGPRTTPSAERASQARRLRRRTVDRVIAGVAAGLGDYLNVDPLLVRAGFAGLMILGGAGLVLYVAAWLLIPAEGHPISIAEGTFHAFVARSGRLGIAVLVFIAVVAAGALLTGRGQNQWRDGALFAVAMVAVGLILLRWGEGARGSGPATAVPGPPMSTLPGTGSANLETLDVAGGDATSWGAPSAPGVSGSWEEAALPVHPQARERSPLGWYVMAASLLAVGVLAVIGNAPGLEVTPGQYLGAVLAVIGIGLVVGAWWGRARLLILLALLITPVAVGAAFVSVPLDGGLGTQSFRPQTIGELRADYRLAGGTLRLDLTAIDPGAAPVTITSSVGVGKLTVVVPDAARLTLDARVAGGDLSVFGNRQTGTGLADRVDRADGAGPTFVLHLEVGIGAVVVETAQQDGG